MKFDRASLRHQHVDGHRAFFRRSGTAPVTTTIVMTALLAAALPAQADLEVTDELSLYGDVRAGYFHLRRKDRDDTISTDSDWRIRVRPGVKWTPTDNWTFAARLAGRFTHKQDGTRFTMDPYAPPLGHGEASFDELYAQYKTEQHTVTAGRFQVAHALIGVSPKSLDRNDSGNVEIHWADGLSWTYRIADGWQTRAVIDHNHRKGASSVRNAPLGFDDSDARWSTFITLENKELQGIFAQRGISVTWLPEALYTDGVMVDRHEDYWTVSARAALRWPIADTGSSFQLGMEGGYAPNTPSKSAVGLNGSGDSKGTAWQVSANWLHFVSGHSVGLVHGRVEAGWLQSPDFIPNQDLLEFRYQWNVDSNQLLEFRVRQRTDLSRPINAEKRRHDVDFHVHYTVTF